MPTWMNEWMNDGNASIAMQNDKANLVPAW